MVQLWSNGGSNKNPEICHFFQSSSGLHNHHFHHRQTTHRLGACPPPQPPPTKSNCKVIWSKATPVVDICNDNEMITHYRIIHYRRAFSIEKRKRHCKKWYICHGKYQTKVWENGWKNRKIRKCAQERFRIASRRQRCATTFEILEKEKQSVILDR